MRIIAVLGYLSGKMSENALVARAFKPPWGKRKVPAFVSKAGTYYGGRNRTRTCDPIDVNDVLYPCVQINQLFFIMARSSPNVQEQLIMI